MPWKSGSSWSLTPLCGGRFADPCLDWENPLECLISSSFDHGGLRAWMSSTLECTWALSGSSQVPPRWFLLISDLGRFSTCHPLIWCFLHKLLSRFGMWNIYGPNHGFHSTLLAMWLLSMPPRDLHFVISTTQLNPRSYEWVLTSFVLICHFWHVLPLRWDELAQGRDLQDMYSTNLSSWKTFWVNYECSSMFLSKSLGQSSYMLLLSLSHKKKLAACVWDWTLCSRHNE